MKLTNIRTRGIYLNTITFTKHTIKIGRKIGRSIDVMFYIEGRKRVFIDDRFFYSSFIKA